MDNKRALLLGLLFWSAYIAARTLLQRLLPVHDWPSFITQDLAVSVIRLSCGAGCLWVARSRWYDSALGIRHALRPAGLALAAMAVGFASFLLESAASENDWQAPHWIRLVEILVAIVVAFNEESGYRLLAYSGLREWLGRAAAVALSSLLFTLMHVGYQPLFHLPKIFMIGLMLALLRDRGVSFGALIALHFLLDSVSAVALSGDLVLWNLYWCSAGLAAVAALLAWLSPTRIKAEGECLLFSYGSLRPGSPEAASLGVAKRCDFIGAGSTPGILGNRGGYPALLPARQDSDRLDGMLLRLRDRDFLPLLDAYEGDDYLRDKGLIQLENGERCEAWIYVAAGAQVR